MLSEGYLSGLAYRNDIQWSYPSSNEQVAEEKEEEMEATAATSLSYSSVDETQVQNLYVSCKSSGKVISRAKWNIGQNDFIVIRNAIDDFVDGTITTNNN